MSDLEIRAAPILDLPRSCEIVVEGGVNASNAALLKERIEKAIDRRTTFISILMRNVAYVNSSGFGYLMDLAASLERRGGQLVLVEVQPKIKLVIQNLGMQNFFRFESSAETARAHLRALAEKVARSPRIVPLDGPDEGQEFPLVGASIRIGRDTKCTVQVLHRDVDPRHAEVYRAGEQCFVKDLGTRFGTWVGDRKVADEPLRAGDVIRVGSVRLAFYPAGATKP